MPRLIWVGKDKVENHHHEAPFRLLERRYIYAAPVSPLPSGEGLGVRATNSTDNRIIHGDNLEALKALLPEFEGRVKCIYIDPPYNTGNENWVYNDNVNDPKIRKWLGQVVGKEGEDLSRHDKWLCMMYPRLKLLHRLLAEEGIIFISIDENEHRYLELLMEEIFGAANKIETLVWKKSYGGGSKSKHIVNLHEYILCFAKNLDCVDSIELPPNEKVLKYYKFKDDKFESRGLYRLQPLATNSMDDRPNLRYSITHEDHEIWPEKQWQWSRERTEAAQKNNELVFTKKAGRWTVSYKQYLKSTDGEERGAKAYSIIDGIYTQQGTNEIKVIFGDGKAFSFPKPSDLIAYLLSFTHKDALILDSFAGSGTTAHAVLKLNAQDGGNRRFILVEMMDYAETITAERVRRVISGYGEGGKRVEGLGGGFEYFTIGPALFRDDGNLNEAVGVAAIRDYVAYTEGIPAEKRAAVLTATSPSFIPNPSPEGKEEQIGEGLSPYFLGRANETDYFFYYEPEQATTLDYAFLARLPVKPTSAVIYADTCALSDHFMRTHGLIFKKIPRDISRF